MGFRLDPRKSITRELGPNHRPDFLAEAAEAREVAMRAWATKVPRPCWRKARPWWTSSSRARLAVMRLT